MDSTRGHFPKLIQLVFGEYAPPNQILCAIDHSDPEFVRAIEPTQALVNRITEVLAAGVLGSKQTHRSHAMLMHRINGIATRYPTVARVVKPPPLPEFSLRVADGFGALQRGP